MRWETENFHQKPERNWKKWMLVLVLLVSFIGVIATAGYQLATAPPTPPPNPSPVGNCNMSTTTCFSYQINNTNIKYNLSWSSSGNLTAAPPTVYLQSVFVNSTLGVVQMQLQTSGASYLNVTVITITDLNSTSRQTYECNHAACQLTRAVMYFNSSVPFNTGDIYQFAFGSSGNLAVYRARFT